MADDHPSLSAIGRILSRLPGFRRYYSTMTALDEDRRWGWARISALEAVQAQARQEAEDARQRAIHAEKRIEQLDEEQNGLKALVVALECEKAVLQAMRRRDTDRDR